MGGEAIAAAQQKRRGTHTSDVSFMLMGLLPFEARRQQDLPPVDLALAARMTTEVLPWPVWTVLALPCHFGWSRRCCSSQPIGRRRVVEPICAMPDVLFRPVWIVIAVWLRPSARTA